MTRLRRITLALGAGVLTAALLGGVALADDGGLMQRMMGSDAYMAMVNQMRTVLGNEQADAMLASCEKMMAATDGSGGMMGGMGQMMSGMGQMMGGH
ncbi:MAG: hypothetical protein M3T56_01545 [Chloroflexota bacterium]|nr:hypothetical protein [Chloroflexota bacterium]